MGSEVWRRLVVYLHCRMRSERPRRGWVPQWCTAVLAVLPGMRNPFWWICACSIVIWMSPSKVSLFRSYYSVDRQGTEAGE